MSKNRHPAFTLIISIAALLLGSFGVNAPAGYANPEVAADQEQVRYQGNGGLILPTTVDTGTRNEMMRCRGCGWKLTAACVPGPNHYCDAAIRGCMGLIDHVRVWFRPEGGDWREVDRICLTHYEVSTVTGIEKRIAEHFIRYVPEQAARCWPAHGAVTRLPLLCESGQPATDVRWRVPISGFTVAITANPSWRWDFLERVLYTGQSGGPHTNRDISHAFPTAGRKIIEVTTRWAAEFTVDGLQPVAIERDLLKRTTLGVTIGQAKARLRCPGADRC